MATNKHSDNKLTGLITSLDFWSATQEEVQLADAEAPGSNVALPDVVVADIPSGATIVRVIALLKYRAVENTAATANKLNGAQFIQVRSDAPGSFANAITLANDLFSLAATTREGGDVILGDLDIASTVTGNDTYNFQWTAALVDAANLQFNDVQIGLRVYYRM